MQGLIRALLDAGTLIVGHTPSADLRALDLLEDCGNHPAVIDIAQLGPQTESLVGLQSVSLRRMAETHLGVKIQQGQKGQATKRHCAIEDAQVAMQLYQHLVDRPRAADESSEEQRT